MIFLDADASGTQSLMQNLILLAIMFLFLYFLFIRPEQKRRKTLQLMQESIKAGQKVYAGSIVGVIKRVNNTTCMIQTGSAEVEVLRLSISFIEPEKEEEQQPIS